MANVTIAYEYGTVFCTPDKGNVSVPAGGQIVWRTRPKDEIVFRLAFRREPFQGVPLADDWPFSQTSPPRPGTPPVTAWTTSLDGQVLRDTLSVYEYLVEVKLLSAPASDPPLAVLDPMIIIGR